MKQPELWAVLFMSKAEAKAACRKMGHPTRPVFKMKVEIRELPTRKGTKP